MAIDTETKRRSALRSVHAVADANINALDRRHAIRIYAGIETVPVGAACIALTSSWAGALALTSSWAGALALTSAWAGVIALTSSWSGTLALTSKWDGDLALTSSWEVCS